MDWKPRFSSSLTILIASLSVLLATDRPNLLLITADNMNWDSVGVYDSPLPNPTPQLDKLAGEGMRFKYALKKEMQKWMRELGDGVVLSAPDWGFEEIPEHPFELKYWEKLEKWS